MGKVRNKMVTCFSLKPNFLVVISPLEKYFYAGTGQSESSVLVFLGGMLWK